MIFFSNKINLLVKITAVQYKCAVHKHQWHWITLPLKQILSAHYFSTWENNLGIPIFVQLNPNITFTVLSKLLYLTKICSTTKWYILWMSKYCDKNPYTCTKCLNFELMMQDINNFVWQLFYWSTLLFYHMLALSYVFWRKHDSLLKESLPQ